MKFAFSFQRSRSSATRSFTFAWASDVGPRFSSLVAPCVCTLPVKVFRVSRIGPASTMRSTYGTVIPSVRFTNTLTGAGTPSPGVFVTVATGASLWYNWYRSARLLFLYGPLRCVAARYAGGCSFTLSDASPRSPWPPRRWIPSPFPSRPPWV